ncbi:MAG: 2-phospho-L-lactate transferase [Dehalococcoidia bacterium]|nr:2-phospho-L-lactate transferase [Dehalococcoidia bacterium]
MTGGVLALAGGVGGAKLALGLSKVLPADELTIVVNTGDDATFHGLHVSPDLDTVMYALAGLSNNETGWGVAGDTFNSLGQLERYGNPAWFNLGDKDLATHIRRTELLRNGSTLSEATGSLCASLDIAIRIVPMTDDPVHTMVETTEGELPFQTYFVREQCRPVTLAIRYDGAERARPSPGFLDSLETASHLIICPSNPFLSVDPILAVPGVRQRLEKFAGRRLAVSPIVGGEAVRGPAGKLMRELGHEVSCVGVARYYQGLCDIFIIDEVDEGCASEIEALGMKVHAAPTIMQNDDDKERLARLACHLLGVPLAS